MIFRIAVANPDPSQSEMAKKFPKPSTEWPACSAVLISRKKRAGVLLARSRLVRLNIACAPLFSKSPRDWEIEIIEYPSLQGTCFYQPISPSGFGLRALLSQRHL